MKLQDILNEIDILSSHIPEEAFERQLLSLCHNSKYASPGCVFFCKAGAITDGHRYAYNAYSNGARVFFAERELALPDDAAIIITKSSANALNKLAVKFYNDPSKELKIIGITGTKGKTTVALSSYLIALKGGIKAGYIGTNGVCYNGKTFETTNTTPDVLELQKALREMRDDGVTTVFLEVSSQALWQERIYGLSFESCVFTNLYRDHIGGCEHPTFEHYRDSKRQLFTKYRTNNIILNADDDNAEYMIKDSECKNIVTASAQGKQHCSLYAVNAEQVKKNIIPGVSFDTCIKSELPEERSKTYNTFIPVPGLYSIENGLLIIAICRSIGLDTELILRELSTISVPGRFEPVKLGTKPNSLFIIDYAHNGAGLRAVLDALREYAPKRIICLFGSVGGRTFERRAELGKAARDCADVIIITSDNPNNELPMNVINDIRTAIGNTEKPVYMIADREDAVMKAYELAEDGDYILLAGKGHESYQLIKGSRVPFSERRILEHADLLMLTK